MADSSSSSKQQSAGDAGTAAPQTPSSETPVLDKPVVLKHRDGRTRTVSTPAEDVAARFDGFSEKAPADGVFA